MRLVAGSRRGLIIAGSAFGAASVLGWARPLFDQSTAVPVPLRTTNVASREQLAAALSDARPGDHIVLANGTYSGTFDLYADGTAANPIVIRSANPHNATIDTQFNLNGNWGALYQLRCPTMVIYGDDCRISRCYSEGGTILVETPGRRPIIEYNRVLNPIHRGIWIKMSATADFQTGAWIHHNHVRHTSASSDKTSINITAGPWAATQKNFNALVEYNLAEGCRSSTTIGCKTSGNTFHFNTCRDSHVGFAQRHGRNGTWIGNSCTGSSPLDGQPTAFMQVFGKGHKIIGNYAPNAGNADWRALMVAAGNTTSDNLISYVNDGGELPPYERAENCLVVGNTGPARVGAGSAGWSMSASNNTIEAHTGPVTLIADRQVGTVDRHDQPPETGVEMWRHVLLTAADVGPEAG